VGRRGSQLGGVSMTGTMTIQQIEVSLLVPR
jgi:hypothetical protein